MNTDFFNGMLQSWDSVHTDVNRMDSLIISKRLTKKRWEMMMIDLMSN